MIRMRDAILTTRLLVLMAVAAVALSGCMAVNVPEDAFFYPDTRMQAEKIILPPDAPMRFQADTFTIPYSGGTIGATRVRTGRNDTPLILFCGGNMFRRSAAAGLTADKLTPFGDVLMFDYPGSGETPGPAEYSAFIATATAVADVARAQADAEGRKLIAWGHSLGGIVCPQIVQHVRADAVVLETTTPNARAVVENAAGWARPLVRINLAPNLAVVNVPAALKGYSGPVVVLEATHDTTLPPALSQKLVRDLKAEGVTVDRLVFPDAGHGDVGAQPDFQSRVSAALAAH